MHQGKYMVLIKAVSLIIYKISANLWYQQDTLPQGEELKTT